MIFFLLKLCKKIKVVHWILHNHQSFVMWSPAYTSVVHRICNVCALKIKIGKWHFCFARGEFCYVSFGHTSICVVERRKDSNAPFCYVLYIYMKTENKSYQILSCCVFVFIDQLMAIDWILTTLARKLFYAWCIW